MQYKGDLKMKTRISKVPKSIQMIKGIRNREAVMSYIAKTSLAYYKPVNVKYNTVNRHYEVETPDQEDAAYFCRVISNRQ